MGIFRNIWNTIFGKSKQQDSFERGGSIAEVPMKVIYKKNKEEKLERGRTYTENELGEPKEKQEKVGGYNTKDTKFTPNNVCNPPINIPLIEIPNGDDFFVSNEVKKKEDNLDSKYVSNDLIQGSVLNVVDADKDRISKDDFEVKKKTSKKIIGHKTKADIKEYILKYGSLDVLTCEQKFKVKSLRNFIWELRKEGLVIKTEKVGLHNELGEKVEVTNYRLISVN